MIHSVQLCSNCPCVWNLGSNHISCCTARDIIMDVGESSGYCPEVCNHYRSDPVQVQSTEAGVRPEKRIKLHIKRVGLHPVTGRRICWAEAPIKIARMILTIKLDGNWSSFQLANSTPPLCVTDSAIAPSARMANSLSQLTYM